MLNLKSDIHTLLDACFYLSTTTIMGIFSFSILCLDLQHNNPNSTATLINVIFLVHTTRNWISLIIVEIKMQLSITSSKLLLFQKQIIVHQCQRIEDIKFVFLSENKSIIHEFIESFFEILFGVRRVKGVLGSIVEHISCSDVFVFVVIYDGRFEAIEREEIKDFVGGWVLGNLSVLVIMVEI